MKNKVTILTITSVLAIANVMCIPVNGPITAGSALNAVRALREGGSMTIGPKEIQSNTSSTSNPDFKPQATDRPLVTCMVVMLGDLPIL